MTEADITTFAFGRNDLSVADQTNWTKQAE
jgi:hypothetical protein